MKILIADDSSVIRRLLLRFLEKWGHEVVICKDGTQAWDELQKDDGHPGLDDA